MTSNRELFWNHKTFAVVGNSAQMRFPFLTYRGLKGRGKTVFPVDPNTNQIDGDSCFPDLKALAGKVEAVVIEVQNGETVTWVKQASEIGIKEIWVHDGTESAEAIAFAKKAGLNLLTGRCAVMYLNDQFPHSFHKWIVRLKGTY